MACAQISPGFLFLNLLLYVLADRDHFQLGSLSHLLNAKAGGYQELPEWPEAAPDPSVRNVEVKESVRAVATVTCRHRGYKWNGASVAPPSEQGLRGVGPSHMSFSSNLLTPIQNGLLSSWPSFVPLLLINMKGSSVTSSTSSLVSIYSQMDAAEKLPTPPRRLKIKLDGENSQ